MATLVRPPRFARAAVALAALLWAALALPACSTLDDEGDDQATTFVTALLPEETQARTVDFFNRNSYALVDTAARLVRAQKRRPLQSGGGDQLDLLTVRLEDGGAGTRVRIEAITYIIENNNQRQAPQVSLEALRDTDALAQFLMVRP